MESLFSGTTYFQPRWCKSCNHRPRRHPGVFIVISSLPSDPIVSLVKFNPSPCSIRMRVFQLMNWTRILNERDGKNIAAKVVGQMGYQVNMYDKWSFLRLTLVWPPMGPPGTVELVRRPGKWAKCPKFAPFQECLWEKKKENKKNDQPS